MSIIAKQPDSQYETCPEGLYHAVCVDVVDLGLVTTKFGESHKIQIRWQTDERDSKARRYLVRQMYTLSLSEKATLRHTLEAWRGRKFTADELGGFDLEKLLGVNCQVQIVHNLSGDGKTYANVQAVVPMPRGAVKLAAEDYLREVDRAKPQGNGPAAPEVDDDIPF